MSARWQAIALVGSVLCLTPAVCAADSPPIAAGLSSTWQPRADYGSEERHNFVPELLAFTYVRIGDGRVHLRPGARVGYSGFTQPQQPEGLAVIERDLLVSGELGVVIDGPLIPSLTIGGGVSRRWIEYDGEGPVSADRELTDTLAVAYAQAGIGIPLGAGRLLLEPLVRLEKLSGDDRSWFRYGAELTIQLF